MPREAGALVKRGLGDRGYGNNSPGCVSKPSRRRWKKGKTRERQTACTGILKTAKGRFQVGLPDDELTATINVALKNPDFMALT
jgi:hypothetical protein